MNWPHQTHAPEAMGHNTGGDICPWCGGVLTYSDTVVDASTGERGEVLSVAPDSVAEVLLHPGCYNEALDDSPELIRGERDEAALDEFTDG